MKKTTLFLILLVLFAGSASVLADGKFYWPESIPPKIPYQRALLWFDGKQETLMVQSKYRAATSAGDGFGWVVPVPSVPELASMDPGLADIWFDAVDYVASPEVTRISGILLVMLFILVHLGAVLTLVACLLSLFVPRMQYVRQHRPALLTGALLILLPLLTFLLLGPGLLGINFLFVGPVCAGLAFLACILSPFVPRLQHLKGDRVILTTSALLSLAVFAVMAGYMLFLTRSAGPTAAGRVEIIKTERVGIYDVQVVKANQAESLIEWLSKNEFQFDRRDQQVFSDYLRRGWCFVVAQIDPGHSTEQKEVVSEGLVAPLIMRFQADAPIYPLALTSTVGHKTQILLYVFSQDKWTSNGRLELHYAAREGTRPWDMVRGAEERIGRYVEPPDFFADGEFALPYLCKFKGTLNPEQMQEDLVFTRVENERPYRKHIIVW
jgi:hypothetical protein